MIPAASAADPPDPERFHVAPHGSDVLSISGAETASHLQLVLGALLHVSDDSVVLRDASGQVVGRLIDSRAALDITMSLGLGDRLELGIALPIVINQQSDVPIISDAASIRSGGIGDVRLSGKLALATYRKASLSLTVPVTLPTGDPGAFIGGEYAISPTAIGEYSFANRVRLLANVGVHLRRPRQFADLNAGTEVQYGAAVQMPVRVAGQPITLVASVFGSVDIESRVAETAPVELLAGVEYAGIDDFVFIVGGGPGLAAGYGTPDFRAFAGLRYRPKIALSNGCANGPEDYDGFEDGDRCGDPDNDGDGVADDKDVCPNEPETRNGVRDDDGCPELSLGTAPVAPADAGGPRGAGGQALPKPELARDTDGDGLAGEDDACPTQREDMDGFEDNDGCPEHDNDEDGIADAADKCPLVAETSNGFRDGDGCPDVIPAGLAAYTGKVMGVRFNTGAATLRLGSRKVLGDAARVLARFGGVSVQIAGHTDNRGSRATNTALSLARANAVRDYLVKRGVDAARISAVGHGPDKPIADNGTPAGRATNRRVEFKLVSGVAPSAASSTGARP